MALVSTVIEQGFKGMIQNKPTTGLDAAQQLADIYNNYAKAATAGPATPTLTGAEKVGFGNALASVFSSSSGSAAAAALAFVQAVTMFWVTPPVVFGAGAVTAFPGAVALQASMLAYFSSSHDTDLAASLLATNLDIATKTILVVIGPNTFPIS